MSVDSVKTEKPELSAANILKASKGIIMPRANSTQEHLFFFFMGVSIACHIGFFYIEDFAWLREPTPLIEEFAIDAELVSDIDLGMSKITTIPDAEKAPEEKMPKEMLPQLPKKFTVKEKPAEVEGIPEKIVPEAKKEQTEIKDKPKPIIQHDNKEANKLKESEIRKRAALEALRKNLSKDDKAKAQKDDPLARLRDIMAKKTEGESSGFASPGAKNRAKVYQGKLQAVIRRNYQLPEAYNLRNAKLQVLIRISVGERGNLLKMEIEKSSGDPVFDEMAVKAVQASNPMPRPPKEMISRAILLNFTPQSF
jgi:TonB family protein